MNRPRTHDRFVTRSGFSLVELLLSIFILSIGIIAIAAVFPAGIAQQQQSNDEMIGPIVASQALGVLRSKLDQDDFGTFEQFGIYLDEPTYDNILVENSAPGDWSWMRPSFLLRGGIFTPTPNLNPASLHGAIDIFGLRYTRDVEGFSKLPEYSGESVSSSGIGNAGAVFATSDFAPSSGTGGIDIGTPDGSNLYSGAEKLYGIPYNRNQFAVLTPFAPGNSTGHYSMDAAREGRDEPLVTVLQSERTWPQNAARPQYVWDCMFRRYQGRIQAAIFVYRVGAQAGEPRPYAVSSGFSAGSTQGMYESPLPARLFFGTGNGWNPNGADTSDSSNKLDDLVVPNTAPSGSALSSLESYSDGWQSPGQWLIDQNGNIHRVLAGRRTLAEGPVRLARPVPHVARHAANGNLANASGQPTTTDEASEVKAIWFVPPETIDGLILTPVFVTVRDL
jgi:type II secretory pathway pseudopilin PulG